MKTIIISIIGVVLLLFIVVVSFRVRKDIKKKLQFENTYAIQNVANRKGITTI